MAWKQTWRHSLAIGLGLLAGTAGAQNYATDPLEHGRLTVWVVRLNAQQPTADQIRSTFQTATAGSFGQTPGTLGQTAGSAGRNPSDLPSRVTSQAASDTGQTAGSFGRELSQLAAQPPGP